MISKAQSKILSAQPSIMSAPPRLSTLDRAMLTWAVLDPGDKVLDASCKDGLLLDYIERNMDCEVCGASDQMLCVRAARTRLLSADIVYATLGDIPWQAEKFDAVFFDASGRSEADIRRAVFEVLRVLKSGGQLVLGAKWRPAVLRSVMATFSDEEAQPDVGKASLLRLMEELGYQHCAWHQAGWAHGVVTCWKPQDSMA